MKRSTKKGLLVLLAVAIVAIAGVILSLPRLIENRLQTELAALGVDRLSLGEPYWGLSGAGTTAVTLAGSYDRWRYRVQLTRVQADYTLRTLLDGEINALTIDAADVRLSARDAPARDAPARAPADLPLADILAALARLDLPVARVALDDLATELALPSRSLTVTGSGLILQNRRRSIAGDLQLALDGDSEAGSLPVQLTLSGGKQPWVPDVQLAIREDGLEPLTASATLRDRRGSDSAAAFPLMLNFSTTVPEGWSQVLARHLSSAELRQWLASGESSATAEASVQLPATLPLTQNDWFMALPVALVAAGSLDVAGSTGRDDNAVLPAPLEAVTLIAALRAEGTAAELAISTPEPGRLSARLASDSMPLWGSGKSPLLEGQVRLARPLVMKTSYDGGTGEINIAEMNGEAEVELEVTSATGRPADSAGGSGGFEGLQVDAGFEMAGAGPRWSLSLTRPLRLQAQLDRVWQRQLAALAGVPETVLADWSLEVSAPQPFALDPTAGADGTFLSYGASGEATGPLAVEISAVDPKADPGAVFARARVPTLQVGQAFSVDGVSAELRLPWAGQPLPPVTATGVATGRDGQWQGDLQLALDDWQLRGRASLVAGAEQFRVSGRLQADSLPDLLAATKPFYSLPLAVKLASGSAQANFAANRAASGLDYSVELGAENVAGLAQGVAFSGVQAGVEIAFEDGRFTTPAPLTVSAAQVSAGVAAENFRLAAALQGSKGANTSLATATWQLQTLTADLFDGEVQLAEPALITLPELGNRLLFRVSNVQLASILGLYRDQGIDGNGVLNGVIPVILESDGVRVDRGEITAAAPGGSIRYAHGLDLANANQQLAMTLGLLENFHYRVLDVTTDFRPSGDLVLAVRLEGRNPDRFEGQQVNFNINFEENIFQLFKVLRLTDELTTKIEGKLKK